MAKKKRKLKIKNILLLLIVVLLPIFLVMLLTSENPFKVEMDILVLDYGKDFKNNFKANFKDEDVTDKVKVEHKINSEKLGKYEVKFIYKKDDKEYVTSHEIEVKDISKPEIILTRGEEVTILINSKYNEPGYEVTDNYDTDLNDSVKVSGEVDTSKEGIYELKYKVKDSSGNEAIVTRKVIVTKDSPLNKDIREFSLHGMFSEVLLEETDDGGKEYSDEFIFAGDYTALYYVIN